MKFSLLLILSLTFALNACTTLANRRDLYQPDKQQGPYTDALNNYTENQIWIKNTTTDNHAQTSIIKPAQ